MTRDPTFRCHLCHKETNIAPDPPGKTICPECCGKSEDGHDYQYNLDRRDTFCIYCDKQIDPDYYQD